MSIVVIRRKNYILTENIIIDETLGFSVKVYFYIDCPAPRVRMLHGVSKKIIFLNSSHFCTMPAIGKCLDSNPERWAAHVKVNFHGKPQRLIYFLKECNLTFKSILNEPCSFYDFGTGDFVFSNSKKT